MRPEDVATIADLVRAGASVRWAWEPWLPFGTLTALAAPAGTGKTRFCCDLLRRVRHGLPWPDGQAQALPPEALSLWVMADNHHDQLVDVAQRWGLCEVVRLNAAKTEPYGGVSLDTIDDYLALEARVRAIKPAVVFVDTVGNSTDKNLSRQEDAKSYYAPLQVLARRYACAVVCVTHLNASGQFLGRRVLEKVRVALLLSKFPGEERLRLEASKSFTKKPPALGVTMGDDGLEYDDHPPAAPEDGTGGSAAASLAPPRLDAMCDWLREALAGGRRRVFELRNDAERAGFSSATLYAAKRRLGLEETEGVNGRKWWGLESIVGATV